MEPTAGLAQTALVNRFFTTPGVNPLDEVEWVRRDAWPDTPKYNNSGVLVPAFWRQNDLDIVSKLYLSKVDPVERKSVRRLIERVWSKITLEAIRHDYVKPPEGWGPSDMPVFIDERNWGWWESLMEQDCTAATLYAEGCHIAVHQLAAFNSPVWFNVGRADRIQQVSACYILGVDDNTGSLMQTAVRNAYIFKYGSGAGYNLSRVRGSMEPLSTGGFASGPMSFRRMYDATNGTFKSGGQTRRAAELVCMDDDHPDLPDFIAAKPREERRMADLIKAGHNLSMDEEGERNVAECTAFQNANMSARLTNAFMLKVVQDAADPTWELLSRTTSEPVGEPQNARDLFHDIAQAAWECADPGVQYHDHFNQWHTTPSIDGEPSPIRSTNPCGEYASNDDTSCNLASINLLKFVTIPEDSDFGFGFDVESYRHVVDTMIVAMDVLVEFSDFPDDEERGGEGKFRHYTTRLRQLGLGYCNLGAAIMAQGQPYDSDAGRNFAAATAALLTGRAYNMSARLAERMGAFHYYDENRDAMTGVIDRHIAHLPDANQPRGPIWDAAADDWVEAHQLGQAHGYRNAQASVMAPTGTISFLMGCDSTGVEPIFVKIAHKELAGGGSVTLIADCVQRGAEALGGYSKENLKAMAEGDFSCIAEEDQATFHGANEISYEGHIKMCGAIQPFVSGGISKTINMPNSATVDDVEKAYLLCWRLGVKNVAIYRDGSKVRQVLYTKPPEPKPEPFAEIDQRAEQLDDFVDEHPEALKEGGIDKESPFFLASAVEQFHTPKLDVRLSRTGDSQADEVAAATIEKLKPFTASSVDDRIVADVDPRQRMPRTRKSLTHKIHIRAAAGREHEGYVHVGFYPDGRIGEFFLEGFAKSGSFTLNALGQWATDFSIGVQYGVPFDVLIRKAAWTADETGGMVIPDPQGEKLVVRTCESVIDYVARYLASVSGDVDLCEELGVMIDEVKERKMLVTAAAGEGPRAEWSEDQVTGRITNGNGHASETVLGPECSDCSRRMFRSGACWACTCGNTTGCG